MVKQKFDLLSNYIDLLLDAICVVDAKGHFVYVSAGAERIFGYKPEEMTGKQMLDMMHPDDRDRTLRVVDEIMAGVPKVDYENRYIRKDGKVVNILWSARWSEEDQVRVAVARDITRIKQAQASQAALYRISEAAHTEESLPALLKRIYEIIAELMRAGQFALGLYDVATSEVTFPFKKLTSTSPDAEEELRTLCVWVSQDGLTMQLPAEDSSKATGWMGVPLHSQNGIVGALMVKTDDAQQPYTYEEQALLEFVSTQIASAIERNQMLERLKHLALYDVLTNLPNRQLFHDRLHQTIARAKRAKQPMALLFLDLDKFKQANDLLGHEMGDKLLLQAATRLSACVRKTDTVARLGGDEFVILLDAIADLPLANQVAEKIRIEMADIFEIDEHQVELSASIGIALYPENGETEQQLLRHADSAMYEAKRLGGNQFHN